MAEPIQDQPSVVADPATCYTVRNGWAWAHVFVRHGVRQEADGRACSWAHVSVDSDYGPFGFCWAHMGPQPWHEFLAGLDFDYAMKKFMGARFQVPLTCDAAAAKARSLVLEARRNGMSAEDARNLFDAVEEAEIAADDAGAFLREWDRHSGGVMYRHELYDANWTQPNPQAVGFWAEIWPHFIAAIKPAAEVAR